MIVHPTYDPVDRVWFTDSGLTAKSLAELQRWLPGAKIQDYYPEGYGNVIHPRPPEIAKIKLHEALRVDRQPPTRSRWPAPDNASEEVVLGEVVEQPEKPVPAVDVQAPKPRVFKPLQLTNRRHRQPSQFAKIDWKDPAYDNMLRRLVEEGLTSTQIGDRMACSRNAIIGAAARAGYPLKHKGGYFRREVEL
jgi:hypothetical protein